MCKQKIFLFLMSNLITLSSYGLGSKLPPQAVEPAPTAQCRNQFVKADQVQTVQSFLQQVLELDRPNLTLHMSGGSQYLSIRTYLQQTLGAQQVIIESLPFVDSVEYHRVHPLDTAHGNGLSDYGKAVVRPMLLQIVKNDGSRVRIAVLLDTVFRIFARINSYGEFLGCAVSSDGYGTRVKFFNASTGIQIIPYYTPYIYTTVPSQF